VPYPDRIDVVSIALLPIVPEVAIPVLIGSTILGTSLVAGGGVSLSIGYGYNPVACMTVTDAL
jgi:hypothetical protein